MMLIQLSQRLGRHLVPQSFDGNGRRSESRRAWGGHNFVDNVEKGGGHTCRPRGRSGVAKSLKKGSFNHPSLIYPSVCLSV